MSFGETARLRAEIKKQVALRRNAEEELEVKRQELEKEIVQRWDALKSLETQLTRTRERYEAEFRGLQQRLEETRKDLEVRERSLTILRTNLAQASFESGFCWTCNRPWPREGAEIPVNP